MQLAILLSIVLALSAVYLLRQWYTGELAGSEAADGQALDIEAFDTTITSRAA